MSEKEQMDIIIQNLFNTLSNLTDARDLLSQNEETKKYLKDYENLEDTIQKNLSVEEANNRYDILISYEQAIGISAFLLGYQKGVKCMQAINSPDFLPNILNKLYN